MCVIAIKPKGIDMPSATWIENMWYTNPDGAGFMYATGKKVVIDKGYMELKDFESALDRLAKERDLKETALVMHFRIGTAGGNVPSNTHPFPISDSIPVLQKLTCSTKLGIVHNGIINITPRQKDISDTMEYIAAVLSPLYMYDNEFYKSKHILQMIGNQTNSKLAFLNPAGQIFTVGNFIEDKGMLFSNTSYLSAYSYRRMPVRAYGVYDYDDYLYDDWYYNLQRGEYVDDLMPLEDGDYVIDMDSGAYIDAMEYVFFIDEGCFLYVYDEDEQMCCPVDGNYSVYNKEGNLLRYNDDKAATMIIYDEDINLTDLALMLEGDPDDVKTEEAKPEGEENKEQPKAESDDVPF